MGLFGGGNSTTQQNTSTTSQDQRQVTDSGAIALNTGGGGVNLNLTSGAAFDLAKHALDTTNYAVQAALAGARQTSDIAAQSAQFATQTAAASVQPASQNIADTLIKIGLPALVLMMVFGKGL